jgi:hypothetical protein
MKQVLFPQREITLDDAWDVIVVGGGPAGCTAAIAAARDGARTLLIEATGALGGMGTNGLVPAWCPFSDHERVIYKGLAEKILELLKSKMPHVSERAVDWVPIDPESLKVIYDDLVVESGAKILFNTMLSAVDTDGNGRVTTLFVTNKAGISAYQAKVYIDCTGDGDLAVWAGAHYEKGGENGELQPASHCFVLSNVDSYGYIYGTKLHPGNPNSPIFKILNSGDYPLIKDVHLCNNFIGPGTIGFNAGHLWDVDNTDPISLSQAMIQGRKLARSLQQALAAHVPQTFGNAFLVNTGSLMGIRETRRVIGDYILTVADYADRRSFEDEICRNCYYIDIHNTPEDAKRYTDGESFMSIVETRTMRYNKGESHGIPYRCLTPSGLSNVLIAGRSISCDRTVQGSVRVMPVCLAMGEAAGAAAQMAAKLETPDVRAIDVQGLRTRLKDAGVYLP